MNKKFSVIIICLLLFSTLSCSLFKPNICIVNTSSQSVSDYIKDGYGYTCSLCNITINDVSFDITDLEAGSYTDFEIVDRTDSDIITIFYSVSLLSNTILITNTSYQFNKLVNGRKYYFEFPYSTYNEVTPWLNSP